MRSRPMAVIAPYPSLTDLAWAAGFWDGEGSSGAYHQPAPHQHEWYPSASISQGDPRVLERFLRIVGVGRVYYSKRKTPYQWACRRRNDIMLLCWMLWPWLDDMKRAQFARALDVDDT